MSNPLGTPPSGTTGMSFVRTTGWFEDDMIGEILKTDSEYLHSEEFHNLGRTYAKDNDCE